MTHPARVMAALRRAYDLDVGEAWQAWRNLREHLARAPYLVDLARHPRIVASEVRAARLVLVGAASPPPPGRPSIEEEYDTVVDYVDFEFTAETEGGT